MNKTDWLTCLKEKRSLYGVSQNRLAVAVGITREYLNKIESGKIIPSDERKSDIMKTLEIFNPDALLTMVFDYVRIRFPTTDVSHVVRNILKLKIEYMFREDYGFYSYTEHYVMGDIFVLTSPEVEKGVLLELKGRGCRQFESFLLAQHRSWYEFLNDALMAGGVMKRLDLAINDMTGILDIPKLTRKCQNDECISVFRNFKSYRSGELTRQNEKPDMGNTLYIGSLSSEVYFCLYEKDYEQYVKLGIPMEETKIKNRFEIRLKNDRAYHAVCDLLTYQDAERTAFSIINRYLRFVDKDEGKGRNQWIVNGSWAYFIGSDRRRLKLTTAPEPYTFERTLNWLSRQVAPTLKLAKKLDKLNGTNIIDEMVSHAKLTERHDKIIRQQTARPEEIIIP